jgi:pimeloyl-ACP methyl ester carboxylesterase
MKEVRDGYSYYVKNNFKKDRETIVFLHGLSGSSAVWTKYFDFFSKNYNVLRIDLIGHGRSKRPYSFRKYSTSFVSKEVLRILKKEKIKSAHFLCHSYALLVALELHELNPKMFKSMVLVSPYLPFKYKFLNKFYKFVLRLLMPFFFLLPVLGIYPVQKYKDKFYEKDVNFKTVLGGPYYCGFKSNLALSYHCFSVDFEDKIKKLDLPVFILSGDVDKIILWGDVLEISKGIKGSKLKRLGGKNHLILYPYYSKIVREINSFLGKLK